MKIPVPKKPVNPVLRWMLMAAKIPSFEPVDIATLVARSEHLYFRYWGRAHGVVTICAPYTKRLVFVKFGGKKYHFQNGSPVICPVAVLDDLEARNFHTSYSRPQSKGSARTMSAASLANRINTFENRLSVQHG